MALWTIDDNPITDSTINLRAEPWSDRLAEDADPSLLFSSYRHGDPNTPLPRAYRGDPFVIRTVNVTGNGDRLAAASTATASARRAKLRDADGELDRDAARTRCSTASPSASPRSSRAVRAARGHAPATTCT